MRTLATILSLFISINVYSLSETETKKTYLEDIFIWKMSDELKLSAKEEKQFTDIQKSLNKKKSELNKKIQDLTQVLGQIQPSADSESQLKLKQLRKLILEYSQISLSEFDQIKKLLGPSKFISYLQIKSELTNKVKALIAGDKSNEKENKEVSTTPLPPPKVIVEKNE